MTFNAVKLQQREHFAACRRMASLAHSFTFQLMFLCHHAGKQTQQSSKCERVLYLHYYIFILKKKKKPLGKRGSIAFGCFRKILAQVLTFCWCYLMISGFTFVLFTHNLLCKSAERIFHCQSGFNFVLKRAKNHSKKSLKSHAAHHLYRSPCLSEILYS